MDEWKGLKKYEMGRRRRKGWKEKRGRTGGEGSGQEGGMKTWRERGEGEEKGWRRVNERVSGWMKLDEGSRDGAEVKNKNKERGKHTVNVHCTAGEQDGKGG